MEKKITLPIKDLALLKTFPKQYHIKKLSEKTHDGTALPRNIRQQFKTFIQKYGGLEDETLKAYDKNGNELTHQQGDGISCPSGVDEVKSSGEYGVHDIHTHPTGNLSNIPKSYIRAMNIPTRFSLGDFLSGWDEKSEDGEHYLYQSTSCCNNFGHVMTLSKNKHYSDDNYRDYLDMIDKFETSCHNFMFKEYYPQFDKECEKILNEYKIRTGEEYPSNDVKVKLFQKAHENTYGKVGSFTDMLEREGIYKGFEDCNCKLKITKIKL